MGPKHEGGVPQYIQVGSGQIREGKEIKEKRGRAEDGSTVVECFNLSWKEREWEGEKRWGKRREDEEGKEQKPVHPCKRRNRLVRPPRQHTE